MTTVTARRASAAACLEAAAQELGIYVVCVCDVLFCLDRRGAAWGVSDYCPASQRPTEQPSGGCLVCV